MYIPIELQKHVLSFLYGDNTPIITCKKGRCICYTQNQTRCKKKVQYLKTLTCCRHNHMNFPEYLANINSK